MKTSRFFYKGIDTILSVRYYINRHLTTTPFFLQKPKRPNEFLFIFLVRPFGFY
nr:MAG TPA: hypothetical protein [Caudoviricetes sp.]